MGDVLTGAAAFCGALGLVAAGWGSVVGGSGGFRAAALGAALMGLSWAFLSVARRVARWRRRG
jgi:hypothetical protein